MTTAWRLNVPDGTTRCGGCGKRRLLELGSPPDNPADIEWCPSCDSPPEWIWRHPADYPTGDSL